VCVYGGVWGWWLDSAMPQPLHPRKDSQYLSLSRLEIQTEEHLGAGSLIITYLILAVPTSTDLYVPVLYSQQLVTVSCPELTNYILTHCLLWFILRLFFRSFLCCRIASDMLFTHISHDSSWCYPPIYFHILCFFLISVLPSVSVFGFHLPPFCSGFGGLGVSMLASGTQDCGFAPDRSRRIFPSGKIHSMPSFGGEVK
jgi:hypothetical protein